MNELHSQKGRYPTEEEVAEYLQISLEKYHQVIKNSTLFHILSLDMVLTEMPGRLRRYESSAGRGTGTAEKISCKKKISQILVDAIGTLKEKEQLVISLYYVEELNMRQIAGILEVSEPRVSQIHSNAIKKLKKYMETSEKDK